MTYRKKMIEVAIPLDAINKESARAVKAQVDVVGPGNEEDGVAWAIREYALV